MPSCITSMVVGKAVPHLPPEVEARSPLVPWGRMRGVRNVVVHEYSGINLLIIWETANSDLSPVVPLLQAVLEREP